jgi:hypothetical protein
MFENNLNWFVTLANPTNVEIGVIQNGIINHRRRAYLTVIGNSHGPHNQLLVGIVELNNAHSLNWLQQNIFPTPNWQIKPNKLFEII